MVLKSGLFSTSGPTGPRGHRAYVVGDVHGQLNLLEEMLAVIEDDERGRPKARTVIVFVGDLIDRGPHSAQVIERLRRFRPPWAKPAFLMGNHEEVMLRVLDGQLELLGDWLKFGGAQCLRSYDLDPLEIRRATSEEALKRLRAGVPREHVKFIRGFADSIRFGSYLFVHAGIRPGVALGEQRQSDLRWIRRPFLDDRSDHGMVVVHGHTISEEVEVYPNRIGIDTGAYRSGVLSAVGIQEADRWFLRAGRLISSNSDTARVAATG